MFLRRGGRSWQARVGFSDSDARAILNLEQLGAGVRSAPSPSFFPHVDACPRPSLPRPFASASSPSPLLTPAGCAVLKRAGKTKAKRILRDVPPRKEDDYDLRKFYTRIQARFLPGPVSTRPCSASARRPPRGWLGREARGGGAWGRAD